MKRVRLTMKQYKELVEARDWCAQHGFTGFNQWYNEELSFQAYRRALPLGLQVDQDQDDERRRDR